MWWKTSYSTPLRATTHSPNQSLCQFYWKILNIKHRKFHNITCFSSLMHTTFKINSSIIGYHPNLTIKPHIYQCHSDTTYQLYQYTSTKETPPTTPITYINATSTTYTSLKAFVPQSNLMGCLTPYVNQYDRWNIQSFSKDLYSSRIFSSIIYFCITASHF